jgi:hypothetical protein
VTNDFSVVSAIEAFNGTKANGSGLLTQSGKGSEENECMSEHRWFQRVRKNDLSSFL